MANKIWSHQQLEIFNWFATGTGNLMVRARAGCAKTTSVIEGVSHAPEKKILLAAFNARIAKELKERLTNKNARALTLHGLGYHLVIANTGGISKVDNNRGRNLARKAAGLDAPKAMVYLIKQLASLGKNMLPKTEADLVKIGNDFDLVPDKDYQKEGWTVEKIGKLAWKAMELATFIELDRCMDFDDQIYLPVKCGWVQPKFDLVVVDEAQDMNAAQLELAMGVCSGRMVVVGDDSQAIYGFRGADSGSLDRLKKELKATELGLTTTYRCPTSVVEYARRLVPDLQAAPGAEAGTVTEIDYSMLAEVTGPGDFVLSRKNAPLVKVCFSMLRLRKRARIEGRDIGRSIVDVVNKLEGRSVEEIVKSLDAWLVEKTNAATFTATSEEMLEAKMAEINDLASTIRMLTEEVKSRDELVSTVGELFDDNIGPSFIVCSSVHKAKGRETDTVFILKDTLYPGGRKTKEEQNIDYVSATRAKKNLIFVKGLGDRVP